MKLNEPSAALNVFWPREGSGWAHLTAPSRSRNRRVRFQADRAEGKRAIALSFGSKNQADIKSTAAKQATTIEQQQKEIQALTATLKAQAAQIQKVSDQLKAQAPRLVDN